MSKQASLANTFRRLIKESSRFMGKSVNVVMFPHQCKKLAVSYSILYYCKIAYAGGDSTRDSGSGCNESSFG